MSRDDLFDFDLLRQVMAPIQDALMGLGDMIAFASPEILETLRSPFDPTRESTTVEEIGEIACERQRELRVRGGRR